MNVRRPTLALLLAVGILATGACSAQQAGTPLAVPGTTPAASTAPVSTVTSVVSTTVVRSTVVTRTVPMTTTDAVTTPTTVSTATPRTTPRTTTSRTTAAVDEVTKRWIVGMCTDMSSVLSAATDVPDIDETAAFLEYRQAFVDYYTALAEASQQALDGARSGLPPRVTHGEQIHRQFITYLTGLQDIASSGAALLETETTASDVSADVSQLSKEIEKLGNGGAGLGDLSSPELAAAIAAAPECTELGG